MVPMRTQIIHIEKKTYVDRPKLSRRDLSKVQDSSSGACKGTSILDKFIGYIGIISGSGIWVYGLSPKNAESNGEKKMVK